MFLGMTLGFFPCYILRVQCSYDDKLCSTTRSDLKPCTTMLSYKNEVKFRSQTTDSQDFDIKCVTLQRYSGLGYQTLKEFRVIIFRREN
jgi:hypothetical protein